MKRITKILFLLTFIRTMFGYGGLYSLGRNHYGQLGDGQVVDNTSVPILAIPGIFYL
jgi:hypothetical protein